MKEVVFKDVNKLIKYLKQPKRVDYVNSVRMKIKDCREVRNWVRVTDFEIVGDDFCIYEKHKFASTVKYIYPLSRIETVKVIRHHQDVLPRIYIDVESQKEKVFLKKYK